MMVFTLELFFCTVAKRVVTKILHGITVAIIEKLLTKVLHLVKFTTINKVIPEVPWND